MSLSDTERELVVRVLRAVRLALPEHEQEMLDDVLEREVVSVH